MAQLKAGSTVGGNPIISAGANNISAASLNWHPTTPYSPTTSFKFVKAGFGDEFYLVDDPDEAVPLAGTTNNLFVNGFTTPGIGPLTSTSIAKYNICGRVVEQQSGELSVGVAIPIFSSGCGQSSSTTSYVPTIGALPTRCTGLDCYPFSAPFVTATNSANIFRGQNSGTMSSSTDGYHVGGQACPSPTFLSCVERFPFSAPFVSATCVGTMHYAACGVGTASGPDAGWYYGGYCGGAAFDFGCFPFSAPTVTSTFIGCQGTPRSGHCRSNGFSSPDTTFFLNGRSPVGNLSRVECWPHAASFPFAAVCIGSTAHNTFTGAIGSGETTGVQAGGSSPNYIGGTCFIDEFPFSGPSFNSTNVGFLTQCTCVAQGTMN